MLTNQKHHFYLIESLKEAKKRLGFCAPNPSVGAVLVKNNKIVARAYHEGPGSLHAERKLLSEYKGCFEGATLYITLEPCNHWGRTPPCVDIIVEKKIKNIVFAFKDPNPIVAQQNITEILKKYQINVTHFPVYQIDNFYRAYQCWHNNHMPFVTAKIAQSLDGKIADNHAKPIKISDDKCRPITLKGRLNADIILTSAKTLINDGTSLLCYQNKVPIYKPIAIIDTNLEFQVPDDWVKNNRKIHIYHSDLPNIQLKVAKLQEYFPSLYYVAIKLEDDKPHKAPMSVYSQKIDNPELSNLISYNQLCLRSIISHIGTQGFYHVWVEAGGRLFSNLHKLNLVNQTLFFINMNTLGKDFYSAYEDNKIFSNPHSLTVKHKGNTIVAQVDWESK